MPVKHLRNIKENYQAQQNKEGYLSDHIVHPYLGFTHIPDENYNEFGFEGENPIIKKKYNSLNVCITGGSVAKQLMQVSGLEIIRGLNSLPEFKEKKINL